MFASGLIAKFSLSDKNSDHIKGANMPEKVVILGASGGCLDTIELILDINKTKPGSIEIIGLLDDKFEVGSTSNSPFKVLGGFNLLNEISHDVKVVNALGSDENFYRKEDLILKTLGLCPARLKTLIHPQATIGSNAAIGPGSLVYQHSTVARCVKLGLNTIVLPNNFIGHDTTVGDFTTINAGCNISGYCSIGNSCYIGTGTSIRTRSTVGDKCLIGMGSNVIGDLEDFSIAYGNPAALRGVIEL